MGQQHADPVEPGELTPGATYDIQVGHGQIGIAVTGDRLMVNGREAIAELVERLRAATRVVLADYWVPVPEPIQDPDALARAAYHAYGQATGGVNYQGLPMPGWEDLGDTIRAAWVAAADVVATRATRTGVDDGTVG